jgi:hypothetical protein
MRRDDPEDSMLSAVLGFAAIACAVMSLVSTVLLVAGGPPLF